MGHTGSECCFPLKVEASSRSSSRSHSPEVSEIYKDVSMAVDNIQGATIGSQEETGQKPEHISAQHEARFRKLSFSLDERQRLFPSKELSAEESLVSISTEDTLLQKEEDSKVYPLVSAMACHSWAQTLL